MMTTGIRKQSLYVIFDGPPSAESGRFIEVENAREESVSVNGGWYERPDGLWSLGPFFDAGAAEDKSATAAAPMMLDTLQGVEVWLRNIATKMGEEAMIDQMPNGFRGRLAIAEVIEQALGR